MGRSWFRLRIRERTNTGDSVKISKFYFARSPDDAAKKYKGNGHVMNVQKASREKVHGIGDFFTLGDKLLREFAQGGDYVDTVLSKEVKDQNADKIEKQKTRGFNEQRRTEATDSPS